MHAAVKNADYTTTPRRGGETESEDTHVRCQAQVTMATLHHHHHHHPGVPSVYMNGQQEEEFMSGE